VIRRTFWLGVGIGVGVTATRRARRLTPANIAVRAVGNAGGFWHDVRAGMREREGELRTSLGLDREDGT
jgi:hypothetical protein